MILATRCHIASAFHFLPEKNIRRLNIMYPHTTLLLKQIMISLLIFVYNNILVDDTNEISKHLAAMREKIWNFLELKYEEN